MYHVIACRAAHGSRAQFWRFLCPLFHVRRSLPKDSFSAAIARDVSRYLEQGRIHAAFGHSRHVQVTNMLTVDEGQTLP